MGMRPLQVLFRAEVPMALPLIIGGLRSALLQVTATATVAAYAGLGGLGRLLIDGLSRNEYDRIFAGAVLVALLAISLDYISAAVERAVVSPGVRARRERPPVPAAPASRIRSLQPKTQHPHRRHHGLAARRKVPPMPSKSKLAAVAAAVAAILPLSACGGDPTSRRRHAGPSTRSTITIGSANFPENELLAEIYAQALEAKGVKVNRKFNIGARELYLKALKDGSIDMIPEYNGALLAALSDGRRRPKDVTPPSEVDTALEEGAPERAGDPGVVRRPRTRTR